GPRRPGGRRRRKTDGPWGGASSGSPRPGRAHPEVPGPAGVAHRRAMRGGSTDRKSTRLNSSHVKISYAVFCLKKKKRRYQKRKKNQKKKNENIKKTNG